MWTLYSFSHTVFNILGNKGKTIKKLIGIQIFKLSDMDFKIITIEVMSVS